MRGEDVPIEVQMTYTVGELARMMRMGKRAVRTWLKRNGIPIDWAGAGSAQIVWLSDLAAALPQFEKSAALKRDLESD